MGGWKSVLSAAFAVLLLVGFVPTHTQADRAVVVHPGGTVVVHCREYDSQRPLWVVDNYYLRPGSGVAVQVTRIEVQVPDSQTGDSSVYEALRSPRKPTVPGTGGRPPLAPGASRKQGLVSGKSVPVVEASRVSVSVSGTSGEPAELTRTSIPKSKGSLASGGTLLLSGNRQLTTRKVGGRLLRKPSGSGRKPGLCSFRKRRLGN